MIFQYELSYFSLVSSSPVNASLFIVNDVGEVGRSLRKVAVAFEKGNMIFNMISRR